MRRCVGATPEATEGGYVTGSDILHPTFYCWPPYCGWCAALRGPSVDYPNAHKPCTNEIGRFETGGVADGGGNDDRQ